MRQNVKSVGAKPKWKVLTFDRFLCLGAAVVLAISAIYTPDDPPGLSICTFHTVTGLPCPGCGLTRSFCAITHARLIDAWHLNPFGFIWYALTVYLLIRPLLVRRQRFAACEKELLASKWGYILPLVLVVAMWSHGLFRMWVVSHEKEAAAATSSSEPTPSRRSPASPAPARDAGAIPSTDSPA